MFLCTWSSHFITTYDWSKTNTNQCVVFSSSLRIFVSTCPQLHHESITGHFFNLSATSITRLSLLEDCLCVLLLKWAKNFIDFVWFEGFPWKGVYRPGLYWSCFSWQLSLCIFKVCTFIRVLGFTSMWSLYATQSSLGLAIHRPKYCWNCKLLCNYCMYWNELLIVACLFVELLIDQFLFIKHLNYTFCTFKIKF